MPAAIVLRLFLILMMVLAVALVGIMTTVLLFRAWSRFNQRNHAPRIDPDEEIEEGVVVDVWEESARRLELPAGDDDDDDDEADSKAK